MSTFLVILVLFVAFILLVRRREIAQLLSPPRPTTPPVRINTGEFALIKPEGFYVASEEPRLEIYSKVKEGIIGAASGQPDGPMVREELNCAWATVSITPGDGIELCREFAKDKVEAVLSEVDGQVNGDRTLTIVVVRKSTHFKIETTHSVIASRKHSKTYELRASVLVSKKAEYSSAINEILESFEIVSG